MPRSCAELDALQDAYVAASNEVRRLDSERRRLENEMVGRPFPRVDLQIEMAALQEQLEEASREEAAAEAAYNAALDDPAYWEEGPEPPESFNPDLYSMLKWYPPEARSVFALACAARLVPAYRRHAELTGRGEPWALEMILERAFEHVTGSPLTRTDLALCIDACIELTPERGAHWYPYALDATSACVHALRCLLSGERHDAIRAARCVYNAVLRHVTERLGVPHADAVKDPLVQAELGRQVRDLYEELAAVHPEVTDAVVHRLRGLATVEGPNLFGLDAKKDVVTVSNRKPDTRPTKVFTEAEYRADPSKLVAHAAEVGDAIVVGPDGRPKFMISIPPAEPSDSDE